MMDYCYRKPITGSMNGSRHLDSLLRSDVGQVIDLP
jgi:hypothetical protein